MSASFDVSNQLGEVHCHVLTQQRQYEKSSRFCEIRTRFASMSGVVIVVCVLRRCITDKINSSAAMEMGACRFGAAGRQPRLAAYLSRSSRFNNFPDGFFGRLSANTTRLGALKPAMCWLQWSST